MPPETKVLKVPADFFRVAVPEPRPRTVDWSRSHLAPVTVESAGALVPLFACYLGARPIRIALTVLLTVAALLGLGAWGAQLGGV